MEDSTATTIEFLRARLLAERSVSRTARQRAYELAKRVTELEKQLKFVSLQRKKAEKAAVDVLAILEHHGTSDLSETFDSSSDQEEISSDFKNGKQAETSQNVKNPESDTEGFSGSEVESSSVNGKSLSWKSSKNSSSHFLEKYMDASRRRRNSFTSTGSSPRRVGKSCRQIRRKEHRSVADGSENDDASNVPHEDEGQTSSEGLQNSADVATETPIELKTRDEKDPPEVPTSSGILQNHSPTNGHVIKHHEDDEEMERALEHQARFIAQYEAEEKAQREWEDKFRENNGSTPDSCDPGTHSDVTEERDEIKAQAPAPAPAPAPATAPPYSTNEHTSETREANVGLVDANEPKTATAIQPSSHMETEPMADQKSGGLNHGPTGLPGATGNFSLAPASDMSDESSLVTRENTDKLGSVLEALQLAKLSLKQNLDKSPLLEDGPSVPAYRSGERFPVPFSSTRLFRLPTDYEYTTSRSNSLTFDPRSSLTHPIELSGGPFISSPCRESLSRSAAPLDDRFRMVPTFPYQETSPSAIDPKLSVGPSVSDPRLSVGPSVSDPRLYVGPSVFDRRSDVGSLVFDRRPDVGPSVFDRRTNVGPSVLDRRIDVGPSATDPRSNVDPPVFDRRAYVGPSAFDRRPDVSLSVLDQRSNVGPSVLDQRSGVGPSALNPRSSTRPLARDAKSDMGVHLSAYDPRPDARPYAFDPRSETGSPFSPADERIPRSTPGSKRPLRARSLYDDYTGPNTYG